MTRGPQDALTLGGGNARRGSAVIGVAPQPHFDEHQHRPVGQDQIDFAQAAAIVALYQPQAADLQEVRHQRFGELAACLRLARHAPASVCGRAWPALASLPAATHNPMPWNSTATAKSAARSRNRRAMGGKPRRVRGNYMSSPRQLEIWATSVRARSPCWRKRTWSRPKTRARRDTCSRT